MTLEERRGAIHVHSVHSDGSGTLRQIIEAGQEAGLDFLVLTDHARDELHQQQWEGRHGDLLVVIASEMGSRRVPHTLVLGIPDTKPFGKMPCERRLAEVKARGGATYIAHPRGVRMRSLGLNIPPWTDWDNPDYDGVEIWCYMHDWIETFRPWRLRSFYRDPHGKITGPHPEVLAAWDRVAMTRRVSGIGGLDACAKPLLWRWIKFFPYAMLFRTILTHVWVPPSTGDDAADVAAVRDALRWGRCSVANHVLGDPAGFVFRAETPAGVAEMGETVALSEQPTLSVTLREPAEVRLIACGVETDRTLSACARFHASTRGPHRVEVHRDGKPWVFSNHIYVT